MSQFLNNDSQISRYNRDGEIDFDDAVKLPEGGSTCDIYRTRWQRRDVFVKRLKEQYRTNPIYLDALDKEFDIGVNLKHPSLPEYREFHRDFIVIDYIDGMTLAEMINRQDAWLKSEKNIVKMLKELVDVVGYLHRHNIVHCDIKPDNIMITANGRNLVLIDFDKSYTDALGDTSGHPGKYGLPIDEKGCMAIDFHGMAMVVEKLKSNIPGFKFSAYRRFVNACNKPNVDIEELNALLSKAEKAESTPVIRQILTIIFAFGGIGVVSILIAFLGKPIFEDSEDEVNSINDVDTEEVVETVRGDSVVSVEDQMPVESVTLKQVPETIYIQQTNEIKTQPEERTREELLAELNMMIETLDLRVKPYFDELVDGLDQLNTFKDDTTLTRHQLMDEWDKYKKLEQESISKVLDITYVSFPNVKDSDLGDLISSTPSYKNYIRNAKKIKNGYWAEAKSRADL